MHQLAGGLTDTGKPRDQLLGNRVDGRARFFEAELESHVSTVSFRPRARRPATPLVGNYRSDTRALGSGETGVCLDTGAELPADTVVVAIGAAPATDWLTGSSLTVDNGLVCDSRCRAAAGIYAVVDVARWYHEQLGTLIRLENRTTATEQAAVVAANILGADQAYSPIPHFWTDQFDAKIQVHGALSADAEVSITAGDPQSRRFVASYRVDGRVTGVVGWKMPKQTRLHRQDIADAQAGLVPAVR
ncbi:FAD-dependent oxidoreductase [Nocardia sp. NBC_01730]|uniref:oxidoreductase C-terminal domain-containing protein n=1 Tax=Nocardia sp. NBC_01730 TaxID=2975998 RepID=UPI002E0D8D23|nr:FAD-dependent oxidoreductase [Nocardia sp. NBC_01730]